MLSLVRKCSKVNFSNNLKVDQNSFSTRGVRRTRKYITPRKWIKLKNFSENWKIFIARKQIQQELENETQMLNPAEFQVPPVNPTQNQNGQPFNPTQYGQTSFGTPQSYAGIISTIICRDYFPQSYAGIILKEYIKSYYLRLKSLYVFVCLEWFWPKN